MFRLRTLAPLCAALALGGCGGGGSKDLYVTVSFPYTPVSVFRVSTILPNLSGFDGHDQRCDQNSGALPTGMHINNDCSISGRPTQVGDFTFGYKVRAEDTNGSFDNTASVTVIGPTVGYGAHQISVKLAAAVNDAPQIANNGWIAPTDTTLTWSYQVASGSLAPGLSLNAATGVISGIPTTAGNFLAVIQPVLSTTYGSISLTPCPYQIIAS
jgi:hypothetical protein